MDFDEIVKIEESGRRAESDQREVPFEERRVVDEVVVVRDAGIAVTERVSEVLVVGIFSFGVADVMGILQRDGHSAVRAALKTLLPRVLVHFLVSVETLDGVVVDESLLLLLLLRCSIIFIIIIVILIHVVVVLTSDILLVGVGMNGDLER